MGALGTRAECASLGRYLFSSFFSSAARGLLTTCTNYPMMLLPDIHECIYIVQGKTRRQTSPIIHALLCTLVTDVRNI